MLQYIKKIKIHYHLKNISRKSIYIIGGHGFWGKGGGSTPGGVLKKIFSPAPPGEFDFIEKL